MARGPVDLSRRCARCFFPPEACLCPDVRRVETRTRFLVLRHASELNRPTNSGRWAALALSGLRLVDYAVPGAEPDLAALGEPGTVVLFPSPHPAPLAPPPRQVVVLDATWTQARRMIQRVPALRTLPRLAVPEHLLARRGDPIRRSRVAGGVCTLEAMAGALHLLGEGEAARALGALHAAALERSWRLRRGSPATHVPRCA